jgi:hypothetical protein
VHGVITFVSDDKRWALVEYDDSKYYLAHNRREEYFHFRKGDKISFQPSLIAPANGKKTTARLARFLSTPSLASLQKRSSSTTKVVPASKSPFPSCVPVPVVDSVTSWGFRRGLVTLLHLLVMDPIIHRLLSINLLVKLL